MDLSLKGLQKATTPEELTIVTYICTECEHTFKAAALTERELSTAFCPSCNKRNKLTEMKR